ncbi:MAG: Na+:solute symporter, partial [Bacteroidota bacterium]
MNLSTLDWLIILAFFVVSLAIGLLVARKANESAQDFFLSGRNMPWWLLGVSMVATTFSADTPNLVTDLVRQSGVAGNWGWWAFLLTGMLTVFVFAKLWRRSMVLTDVEFYELRYSGKMATFLRGFRALYLGLIFNVLVMGAVSLAAVKFGEILLGIPGWQTLLVAGTITL